METKHREEILRFTHMIEKAYEWLPHLKELFRIERLCRLVGFSVEQTAKLMFGDPIEYSGMLYSEEHKQNFKAERASVQIVTS